MSVDRSRGRPVTAPAPTDSLFFAIYPDAGAAVRLARLALRVRAEHGLKGRPVAAERFHVTLHHLGAYAGVPEDVVAMARDAAGRVAMPPFDVAFDRAGSFSGRRGKRPFVLKASAGMVPLIALQEMLGAAMATAGFVLKAQSRFTPHVTLLYDERHFPEETVETIGWTVSEFVLVRSLLGRSEYVPLARWGVGG
ncbi:2'-5' RNA ligase [Paraburkholderia sp. BL8N3]|jgi:2'-5' RNA ligase|nr:RNA 2',3'-cyclic phosphodiesterase [Paraburkholderia sp. BL8N3]TCK43285.1 2'-5' RNA ligase [Paraburkholderia sp. BL8N3]